MMWKEIFYEPRNRLSWHHLLRRTLILSVLY